MDKAACEYKIRKGVFVPSIKRELDIIMNKDYWKNRSFNKFCGSTSKLF